MLLRQLAFFAVVLASVACSAGSTSPAAGASAALETPPVGDGALWHYPHMLEPAATDGAGLLIGVREQSATELALVVVDPVNGIERSARSVSRVRRWSVAASGGRAFVCNARPIQSDVVDVGRLEAFDVDSSGALHSAWSTELAGSRCEIGIAGGRLWTDTGLLLDRATGSTVLSLDEPQLRADVVDGRLSRVDGVLATDTILYVNVTTETSGALAAAPVREAWAFDAKTGARLSADRAITEGGGSFQSLVEHDVLLAHAGRLERVHVEPTTGERRTVWSVPGDLHAAVVGERIVAKSADALVLVNPATGAINELAKRRWIGAPVAVGEYVVAYPYLVDPSGGLSEPFATGEYLGLLDPGGRRVVLQTFAETVGIELH